MYIFVYGTLMRGFSNHRLMGACKFIGNVKTVEKYGFYVSDFPFVSEKSKVSVIHGELYEVPDEETLQRLDALEGHPDWYERKPVAAVVDEGDVQRSVVAELYFNEVYQIQEDVESVLSGRFQDSLRSASHC